MGKSIRSKIKKYWRSQLRGTIGKVHLEKQEEKIQLELKKAMQTQEGCSIFKLKSTFGTSEGQHIAVSEEMAVDTETVTKVIPPALMKKSEIKKNKLFKSKAKTRRGKKMVNFYTVLKKGA